MDLDLKTDEELLEYSLIGNHQAFEKIVIRYADRLYYFAKTYRINDDEAKDLVQESFFKLWKNRAKYNKRFPFKTWLYTITKNSIIDYLRKDMQVNFSDLENEDEDIDFIDENSNLEDILVNKQDQDSLSKIVNNLNNNYKKVVLLHYEEGLTFKEVGRILGKPTNTVKSWHYRAISEIRDKLQF